jgi:hypothetical protein
MALMNWKQNIGEGHITPQRAKELLKNFNYATEIDAKGRLLINAGMSKFVIAFKDNGPNSTIIGVTHFKMKSFFVILDIILCLCFVLPGLIFSMIINSQRKKTFTEAVRVMNLALNNAPNTSPSANPTQQLEKLNELKEKNLISPDEYEKKKQIIIDAI